MTKPLSPRRFLAVLPLILVLVTACAEGDFPPPPTATPSPTSTPTPSPSSPTPIPSITLAAVGDIMLARSVEQLMLAEGAEAPFAGVTEVLRGADVTVGNLESAISTLGGAADKEYTFRAPPLAVEALQSAGFDAVAQSNNHSLDFGSKAMLDTLSRLRAAGIAPVGAGATMSEARAAVVMEVGGVSVAFLSYTDIPSPAWAATVDKPGIAWLDAETIPIDIAEAATRADVVVVLFHFGVEESLTATDAQREQARAAIDAGATLVLGSHPHVLQEVEEYGGGLIAYSLGNFVFDGFNDIPHANASAILLVKLTTLGLDSWEMVPVVIVDGLPKLGPVARADGRTPSGN